MSSPSCGSSKQQQAEFVQASFQFWDENADRIGLINYLWLRDSQGLDKGAFGILKTEAQHRSF